MSPKIPPFIFLVFCNRTNVKKSQRVPPFRFFGTMRLENSHFLFLKNFSSLAKISKCPPFTVFGIVRFFKSNNFCLKIRFSQVWHAISYFCFFFKRPLFFLCEFFSNLFPSKPSQFLLETKRFASIKHCSRFSALCDLPETFIKKNFRFRKIFFLNFLFLRFTVEKDGFSVGSSWRRIVFEIYGYPFGFFWRCKIDEILTIMSFYPWLRMILLIWVSSKVRKCLRSTASPLCTTFPEKVFDCIEIISYVFRKT